ncbi:MAG: tRNA (adenosine(37)-N6)-dimethylallyltransferase MiaA, partial [Myxococcota bacterium]
AKPSPEQRALVPHHGFDMVNPTEVYSAGRFVRDAREAASRIHARRNLVILTGGTGLYIRAFLEGLVATGGADLEFRESLEREHACALRERDPSRLHRRLQELDPAAASRIHPNDLRRSIRALEILHSAERPASLLRDRHAFSDRPYRSLHLAIDPGRAALGERIDQRCRTMIDAGLLREVRELRDRGFGPDLRPMQAIGYRHINPVVDGADTLVNALAAMQRDTRRFARRQRTWLRGVEQAQWMDPADPAAVLGAVEVFLKSAGTPPSAERPTPPRSAGD